MKRFFAVLSLLTACAGARVATTPAPPPSPVEPPAAPPPSQDQIMAEVRRGNDAHKAGDWATFLDAARAAQRLSPENPDLRYRLARALVRAGEVDQGIAELDRLASMKLAYRIDKHPDLASLAADPRFVAVRDRMAGLVSSPVEGGVDVWTLPAKDLLVESIAHDENSGAFFLSMVHARKIVRVEPSGAMRDFVPPQQPGWGFMGMRADAVRRALWVGRNAMSHVAGFQEADKDRGAVLRVNLDTGAIEQRLELPGAHSFGDLTVAKDGAVWVSDSVGGGIYRGRAGAATLEEIVAPGRLRAPQGLAFSADEKRLYVADYAGGLFVVDVASRRVAPVAHADDVAVYGIDGLYALPGNRLLGVQNGVQPHRLVLLRLEPAGPRIAAAEILDMNDKVIEPTHAVVVGNEVYYVATSQWRNFDGDGKLLADKDTTPAVVRRVAIR